MLVRNVSLAYRCITICREDTHCPWQTPCSHRASKSKHLHITKVVSAKETLYYTVLHNFTADKAIAPARWSFKVQSCIFRSCIFHPCKMVLHFPVLHFQRPSNKSNITLTLNFFSCTKITYASVFWGKWTGDILCFQGCFAFTQQLPSDLLLQG